MCLKKKSREEKFEMPHVCAFCEKSVQLCDEDSMLCKKNGIVPASHKCKKFVYDPLKRVPAAPPKMAEHDIITLD